MACHSGETVKYDREISDGKSLILYFPVEFSSLQTVSCWSPKDRRWAAEMELTHQIRNNFPLVNSIARSVVYKALRCFLELSFNLSLWPDEDTIYNK